MKLKEYISITLITAITTATILINFERLLQIISNRFDGLATLSSAIVVIGVYYIEQRTKKINAARLILKEIDSAIEISKKLSDEGRYDQKTIAIATDNWPNQIHFFVKDMSQKEIDQINKIYSRGKYITKCINEIDEYKKEHRKKLYEQELGKKENEDKQPIEIFKEIKLVKEIERKDDIANTLIGFAKEAADEIKDAKLWTSYDKLKKIAEIK